MKIGNIKVNGVVEPLGYQTSSLHVSYELSSEKGKVKSASQIMISNTENFSNIIYDSGRILNRSECFFYVDKEFESRTKYFFKIIVWDSENNASESECSWFETGKIKELWNGKWIAPVNKQLHNPNIIKVFTTNQEIRNARLYCCALGLYEVYLNGKKVGDEYLAPGYNDYSTWIQAHTHDVTGYLANYNELSFNLGDGWFKGNFGFGGGKENIYGSGYQLIAELHIEYMDGSSSIVCSDDSWKCTNSSILKSGIYYGEKRDDSIINSDLFACEFLENPKNILVDRLSLPIKIKDIIKPSKIITNKKNEVIIDLQQNMVGWLAFKNTFEKGKEIKLEYGEILQDGCFYRENLRFAEAQYTYISDGKESWIRPRFTYYGFRYVKISGMKAEELDIDNFVGEVVYSDLEITGNIETSDPKINQLFQNTLWSQKGNFVDVPTDCPQRDERMGWTGDAQVFSSTASYNMDTQAFFVKYLRDLAFEQGHNGAVPMTVPDISLDDPTVAAAVWGDVCTILPWNVYKFYGDKSILINQLTSMKKWINYIQDNSENYLWNKGFQFGDWLALDGKDKHSPIGGTEETLIASIYSYLSTKILAESTNLLEDPENDYYQNLLNKIRKAIQTEYLSPNGRLVINTQTAYSLILYFELFEPHQKEVLLNNFKNLLKENGYSIQTGFVGTPILCLALSKYGEDELAYTVLLNEDCPSWLYQVNMGATTIWERWDSVLPNGLMNPEGMNSLNHYAYGSIVQWMYEYMLGIQQLEDSVGFSRVKIQPKINWRLREVKGSYHSRSGKYTINWEVMDKDVVNLNIIIPVAGQAKIVIENTSINCFEGFDAKQVAENVELFVNSGKYEFRYKLSNPKDKPSIKKSLLENYQIPVAYQLINKFLPKYKGLMPHKKKMIDNIPLNELNNQKILGLDAGNYQKLIQSIGKLSGERTLVEIN